MEVRYERKREIILPAPHEILHGGNEYEFSNNFN